MVFQNDSQFKTFLPEIGNEWGLKLKSHLNFVELGMNPDMIL